MANNIESRQLKCHGGLGTASHQHISDIPAICNCNQGQKLCHLHSQSRADGESWQRSSQSCESLVIDDSGFNIQLLQRC